MQDSAQSFNPFAPGFDFLQKLAAGSSSKPSAAFAQWQEWVAPTMNVPDLEKRIQELKTVLFWLEQNQRALAATIQAMEVQKMTLSALQTMNVPVENWASTMVQSWQQFAQSTAAQAQEATQAAAPQSAAPAQAAPSPAPAATPAPAPAAAASEPPEQAEQASNAAAGSVTDPMQWWGALTQQFQHIAQQAVQDVTEQAMAHAASTQQAA
ncbi:PhaM family polyhydroxyalkanoate granule multifunctional regulatory protein, partial [Comamonas sp. B-9]|uniref:PhaM family polyhydroxyalkanoate granule multifunctional regulatory protein n=1 Tax=Comamonas sp. B-9 TaxID=1055192 RepID=UPI000395AF6E